jgi:murein DD-endopeptidase MepM/ murein hydrolase activator NlpD
MNTLDRHPAPRLRAAWRLLIPMALLAVGLSGCGSASYFGGPTQVTRSVTRPDPPPIPRRKPEAPARFLTQAAPSVARIPVVAERELAETVASAPPASGPITVQPQPPLRKPAAEAPGPAPSAPLAPSASAAGPSGAGAYRVQAGDTVYGVSRRFAVPVRGVIDANSLKSPYRLRVGQVLRVPNPRRHRVQAGDTVYGVARRYGIDPNQIVRLNRIAAPYAITPGQSLVLTASPTAAAVSPQMAAVPPTGSLAAIPAPPPRASGKFLWPVQGRTIAGYGRKENGLHNDGINIAAPRGAAVRAADNGVVAYVGNELRGFGNLILVRHDGGWVTAYAHNQDFLVTRGQTVQRGQTIARVGSSGNVATPQLHFEIRKGTQSVNPTRFLGPQRVANAQPG